MNVGKVKVPRWIWNPLAPIAADVEVVEGACVTVTVATLPEEGAALGPIGTPVKNAVPVMRICVVTLNALAEMSSVHDSNPPLISQFTATFAVAPSVAISAIIETRDASSTSVTTSMNASGTRVKSCAHHKLSAERPVNEGQTHW